MIRNIIPGDITSPDNPCDIIIGMNSQLQDVTGIGRTFVQNAIPQKALGLGSVISYDFDESRKLHMIICHDLGRGGWRKADMYVRFGLDYLNHLNDGCREHSIVQIGTGRIGKRDSADHSAIHTAMANSFLELDLYVFDSSKLRQPAADIIELRPLSAWSPRHGDVPVDAIAA